MREYSKHYFWSKKDLNEETHYYFRINNMKLVEVDRDIYMICIKSSINFNNASIRELDKRLRLLQNQSVYHDDSSKYASDVLLYKDLIKALYNALNQLSKGDRELIEDIYFKDVSERKIATKTGIPRTTISYRKKRILKFLKISIEKEIKWIKKK